MTLCGEGATIPGSRRDDESFFFLRDPAGGFAMSDQKL
jgi:hypothetical protein